MIGPTRRPGATEQSEPQEADPLSDPLAPDILAELEATAAEFANLAGAEITASLGRSLAVRYKSFGGNAADFRDPVSEIDHKVEVLLRARLAERFAEHDIIGEELDERPGRNHDFVWAIDPVDGTANFVNGFPLFAASIGVLHRGQPVAGAVWCATSHALRSGVYHARRGGPLCFDGEPLHPRDTGSVQRRLAGEPHGRSDSSLPWDSRKTGSAAIECAFVAAGLLRVARFDRPNLWDVAGGVVLVRAAGGDVWLRQRGGWRSLDAFAVAPPDCAEDEAVPRGDLRTWRGSILLGEPEATALLRRRGAATTRFGRRS